MHLRHHLQSPPPDQPEQGQALVEYVLIVVLVAFIFGIALASTGGVIGNVFSNSINDLLRQTEVTGTIPGREDFWNTVTASFLTPVSEKPLPSNTPAPPTTVPTAGPSPTNTPTVPTPLPSPTRTPTLTPTVSDEIHDLDFYDSVDAETLKWWRADANINLLGQPWTGQFYSDANFTTTDGPAIPGFWKLDFTGDATTPWVVGKKTTNFSARFTRTIELSGDRSITIRTLVNDGVKVQVDGATVPGLDKLGATGTNAQWFFGSVALTAGTHNITVDYKQGAAASRLQVLVQGSGSNPDDTGVNGGGNPASNAFACGWGQNFRANGNDANTETGMFDEFVDGEIAQGSRCYLELRGAVNVPSTTINPQLAFWDVWDLQAPASAWIEIGEYIQAPDQNGTPAPVPSLDRGAVQWRKINLHTGGTKNYNYTRNVINLKDVTPALDFTKPITFRFVIQNTGNNTPNRWYIDDFLVQQAGAEKVFKLNQPTWTLDEDTQMDDFIATGGKSLPGVISGWRLTSNNKLGPGGMSFHDSVGATDNPAGIGGGTGNWSNYKRHTETPDDFVATSLRLHTLEFDGWIDLDPTVTTDADGNKGDPVLSFYQGYDVGSKTGLEVQWTTDPFNDLTPQWTTFSDGIIVDVNNAATITNTTLQQRTVRLKNLTGSPAKIRIRFVMKVQYSAVRRDGWWIDQIRVGREETPKWVDYPYKDDAQYFITGPYRYFGKWTQTELNGRRNADEPPAASGYKRRSYASSPGTTYAAGQKTWMEMRFAVDMYNDTQTNAANQKTIWNRTPPPADPANSSNTFGAPAVNPILSFYHYRDLSNSDDFIVQWKRIDKPDTAWKTVWLYKSGMATSTTLNAETSKQKAWERVEIDLTDVMADLSANNTADVRDDDIVFRFYLDAKTTTSGEGLYIDDIQLAEQPNQNVIVYKLWPSVENRNDPRTGTNLGTGNSTFFTDDPDASSTSRLWTDSWFTGGDWFAVNWGNASKIGTSGFHDSPVGDQDTVPDGVGNYIGEATWTTQGDRFEVLELNNIIDLRAVDADQEDPALYFWTRYHIGGSNGIRVEISEEMRKSDGSSYTSGELDTDIRTRCKLLAADPLLRQCYEQRRGWTSWAQPVTPLRWERKSAANSEIKEYGWERAIVGLEPYTYNSGLNRPGKRIRIRFVYDTLTATSNVKDGWYVDNIVITHRKPPLNGTVMLKDAIYDNTAGSMVGMVGEGTWGLDPNINEGGGGSPTSFGTWQAYWWDCDTSGYNCLTKYNTSSFNTAAKKLLDDPARPTASNRPGADTANWWGYQVIGLNYNLGNGKPAGAPATFSAEKMVGEFVLNTPIAGSPGFPAGNRTMLIESDDGVRAKIQELDGSCTTPTTSPNWNIVDNWKDQSPTTVSGSMNFADGKCYRITVQYYDGSGGATLRATIGDGKYSYSDSPKKGGSAAKDEYPIPLANTSLKIDRIFDLTGVPDTAVTIMAYRTKYRVGKNTKGGADSKLLVEVSEDGGFSWIQTGLSTTTGSFTFSNPTISQALVDPDPTTNTAWQQRLHNLTSYKNKKIVIRFRYDRQGEYCMRTNGSTTQCDPTNANSGAEFGNGYFDGWWISRITIAAQ